MPNKPKVNFEGAYLKGADYRGLNFMGVSFRGANLRDANFEDCDLTGADFQFADLRGADFALSKGLENADLSGARMDSKTRWPGGFDPLPLVDSEQFRERVERLSDSYHVELPYGSLDARIVPNVSVKDRYQKILQGALEATGFVIKRI